MQDQPKQTMARPSAESVRARLAEAGLAMPETYIAGVAANLVVLQDHVATLRGFAPDRAASPGVRA